MKKCIYAKITNRCNLSCPHCDIKMDEEIFNHDKFINTLREFDGRIIFFGGEPTLYQERLLNIAYDDIISKKERTITTNLTILNDDLIKLYHDLGDSIATSWNPNRFNDTEYKKWLSNINWLKQEGINALLMITLTEDLISIKPEDFMEISNVWDKDVFKSIRFEQLVSDNTNTDFFNKVDNWLCDVYKIWNNPIKNAMVYDIQNWYYDCSEVYTIEPNGDVYNRCPHIMNLHIPNECYECIYSDKCKPCQLQKYCSFPKKFFQLINQ